MKRLAIWALLSYLGFCAPASGQGIITTVAGSNWVFPPNVTMALNAPLGQVSGVTVDSHGNVYLADSGNAQIFAVSPNGGIRIVAGNGTPGFSGDGGPATAASLSSPYSMALDASGNLFVADWGNARIRKVSASGIITTVAGGGTANPGNGGPAASAQLYSPAGIAVDASGDLFFADSYAQVIRKVSAGGIVTTVAGNGTSGFSGDGGPAASAQLCNPEGVALDAAGDLFIADACNNRIRKVSGGIIATVAGNGAPAFTGDGGPAAYASLYSPQAVAVDTSGNLYIADYGNNRVRRVAANGLIATFAGDGGGGFFGDGGPAIAASLNEPEGVAVDAAGNVFIADAYNNRVRKVAVNGVIATVAGNGNFDFSGDGGPAVWASLNQPYGVAVDAAGDLFLADRSNNRVRKVSANGVIATVAGNGTGISFGDGGQAVLASLDQPCGLAVDASGNLFIADSGNGQIRKVSASGIISTVAGGGSANLGDGGPATAAQLLLPAGIAVDAFGDLFIADTGDNRIRKVSAGGIISTVAGNGARGFSGDGGPATSAALNQPTGVAVDATGNIFVADAGNNRIRRVSTSGVITTVAGGGAGAPGDGGPATAATLNQPGGIAVDASGNLFIADTTDNRIREVSVHGVITTVAGNGSKGFSGDGGPAASASLWYPQGVAVDAYGNLFLADNGNFRIREVSSPASALTALPASLGFSLFTGGSASQHIGLSSTLAGLAWSASPSASWFSLWPSSGTVPGTITVIANTVTLPPGTYNATIAILNSHASPPQQQTVSVSLTVAAGLSVAPVALYFNAVQGGAGQSRPLQIGGVPGGAWQAVVTTAAGAGWLSVSPGVGQVPAALTAYVNPGGLAVGVYQGTIAVKSSGGIATASVTLTVASGQGGAITTVAGNGFQGSSGDGGDATSAELFAPEGVAVDASGNSFIADTDNNLIRKVSAGGTITTVAGNRTEGFSGDGGPAASAALNQPQGIAVDSSGNLFIADTNNNLIRKVSAGGIITTVAGNGNGGFSGDGGPAASAALAYPSGVAVDSSGNLFIADRRNNRIRKVSASGTITTVAGNATQGFSGDGGPATSASLNLPSGVAVDAFGNLFIADGGNNRIRKVPAGGSITTVAGNGNGGFSGDGGPATSAGLSAAGVAVDTSGNLFIADALNNRVRKVSASGTVTTAAGNGTEGFSGDGGPAAAAELSDPAGVAVDASGNLFIADNGNERIREVSTAAPLPSIAPGGIVPVDSTVATIQPGEWVSIYGTNLAASTVAWNGNFPQSLGGTSVTIDGKAAYLSFVSPTQINLQAPDDTAAGPVPVVVTTANGTATATVTLAQFGPSFLLLDGKHVAGIILRPNGSGAYGGGAYDIIGPTGNSLGYATVAAKAGDAIELFAVGLGPTNPPVPAGQVNAGAAATANPVNLLIGNASVTPAFAGLSGAGLYQINLTVPAGLAAGDVPLAAAVGGAQTPAGVAISLQ
jgi:uncharacterized protein (TIGR03437 family)